MELVLVHITDIHLENDTDYNIQKAEVNILQMQ